MQYGRCGGLTYSHSIKVCCHPLSFKAGDDMSELRSTGERWFPEKTSFSEDMHWVWGEWGLNSEVGKLRAVLLRKPGKEIEDVDPKVARFSEVALDVEEARREHDELAEIYRNHGVEVYYVEETCSNCPNAYFVHDQFAMTPEGAIIARPAMKIRRKEVYYTYKRLAELGIPILRTVHGHGTFEGADLLWVNEEAVVLGIGVRTNQEGARQVVEVLRTMGVKEVIEFHIPYGQAHVDGRLNIVDKDLAILFPWHVPYTVASKLKEHGYDIIEVEDPREAIMNKATNVVALEPGTIVMGKTGAEKTKQRLREAGVKIVEVKVDELMKGRGGISCMTGRLKRDKL